MTAYSAGSVVNFGRELADASSPRLRALFMIPAEDEVHRGLAKAADPEAAVALFEEGLQRLVAMTRQVSDWYLKYEFFHLQYKHGLKLPFSPFSHRIPEETVRERRENVSAPLIAFTNEPLSRTLKRPPSQQAIVIPDLGPAVSHHLEELVERRDLLRYQMSGGDVDLDGVVDQSFAIARLLSIARDNRLALSAGLNADGQQAFRLPAQESLESMRVSLQLDRPVDLNSFQKVPRK